MRAELRAVAACAVLALGLLTAGCGSQATVRIGVLADCRGAFGALNELLLAGAEFPLLERGAHLHGVKPSDGITAAHVAGQRVELVTGCSESGVFDILVAETRRLVDIEHADVVVGGLGAGDSLVVRELARRYPTTSFVLASSSLRETTASGGAPNLFRFEADDAQQVAGLGTYAYRDLGWRRAAVVADDYAWGWAQTEAFAAEFCALGGDIVSRLDTFPYDPTTNDVSRVPVADVDGVAAFVTPFAASSKFVRTLARRLQDPGTRLVLGPWIAFDPIFRNDVGRSVAGAVTATTLPGESKRFRDREQAFAELFPPSSGLRFGDAGTRTYANAVEAVLLALEAADGDASRLRVTLARTTLGAPDVARLDGNRQAIVSVQLARLTALPDGKNMGLRPIRTIPNVDESFGGLLPATPTSAASAACHTGPPAPWAR